MGKELSPIEDIRGNLDRMLPQFEMALPQQIDPKKFVRVLMTALQNAPDLLNCDRTSLYSSSMKCAADGLLPDGREAALVKFGDKVQYMPMIGGILKKVRNSGELASITSQVIYKNDVFKYWVDDEGEHLEHVPLLFGDRGDLIGVYAQAKTRDGAVYVEVMTEKQIEAIKSVSRSKGGPWAGPFADEMRRKTAIRRLSKRLPMSTDLEQVITRDDEMYDADKTEAKTQSDKPSRVGAIIEAQTTKSEPVPPVTVPAEQVPI